MWLVYGDTVPLHLRQAAAVDGSGRDVHFESRAHVTSDQAHDWQWSVVWHEDAYTDVVLCWGNHDPTFTHALSTLPALARDAGARPARVWVLVPARVPPALVGAWFQAFAAVPRTRVLVCPPLPLHIGPDHEQVWRRWYRGVWLGLRDTLRQATITPLATPGVGVPKTL